jgi:hypothetical protein
MPNLKRARPEAARLRVPDEILGLICSFLIVRETLDFVTLVVKRPWLRVPWNRLERSSVKDVPDRASAYRTARKLALVRHLNVLEVVISSGSITAVQTILNGARNLRSLNLWLYGQCSILLQLLGDVTPTVTDLVVSLDKFDDDNVLESNADLAIFLRSFPILSSLTLSFYDSWFDYTGGLVASTLYAVPRTLIALKITGIEVAQDVLEAVVVCCPHLSRLAVTLTGAHSPNVLRRLKGLRTAHFIALDVAAIEFVQHMSSLRELHVWLERGFDPEVYVEYALILPEHLAEFRCFSTTGNKIDLSLLSTVSESEAYGGPPLEVVELPASTLLRYKPRCFGGLRTLVCLVEPMDVFGLLQLLADIEFLQVFHVKAPDDPAARKEVMHLLNTLTDSLPTGSLRAVFGLVLEDFTCGSVDLAWLQRCSGLTNLTFCGGRSHGDPDLKRAEAFKVCPKLRSLVDTSTGRTVTVSKTDDGRLIKRMDDRVSELQH